MSRWFDLEEAQLERQLMDGFISQREYNEAIRDMRREFEDEASERAMDAYDDVMGNW